MTARGELRARLIRCAPTGSAKARAEHTNEYDRTDLQLAHCGTSKVDQLGWTIAVNTISPYDDMMVMLSLCQTFCNVEWNKYAYSSSPVQRTAWPAGVP